MRTGGKGQSRTGVKRALTTAGTWLLILGLIQPGCVFAEEGGEILSDSRIVVEQAADAGGSPEVVYRDADSSEIVLPKPEAVEEELSEVSLPEPVVVEEGLSEVSLPESAAAGESSLESADVDAELSEASLSESGESADAGIPGQDEDLDAELSGGHAGTDLPAEERESREQEITEEESRDEGASSVVELEEIEELSQEDSLPVQELSEETADVGLLAAAEEEFGLTVSAGAPDSELKCGVPVTFTMTPENGSGPMGDIVQFNGAEKPRYMYLVNTIMMKVGAGAKDYESVVDPTRFKYEESNEFSFTFTAPGSYYIVARVMDFGTMPLRTASKRLDFTISDGGEPSLEEFADGLVKKCNEAGCTTDYEKALYFHDWIINNAVYDNSFTYMGAEGVLLRGKGTCESYHRALELLLGKVGIPCERAEGNGHVWSCVLLDGEWTQIDATWNGGSHTGDMEYMRHLYFGITDEMTQKAHSEHKPVSSRPCTSYERNYFIRSGKISKWTEPLRSKIEEKLSAGETTFSIEAERSSYPNVYYIIYPLTAYSLDKELRAAGLCGVEYVSESKSFAVSPIEESGGGESEGETDETGSGSGGTSGGGSGSETEESGNGSGSETESETGDSGNGSGGTSGSGSGSETESETVETGSGSGGTSGGESSGTPGGESGSTSGGENEKPGSESGGTTGGGSASEPESETVETGSGSGGTSGGGSVSEPESEIVETGSGSGGTSGGESSGTPGSESGGTPGGATGGESGSSSVGENGSMTGNEGSGRPGSETEPPKKNSCADGVHSFNEWIQTTAPTCTATGELRRECRECHAVENKVISKRKHTYKYVLSHKRKQKKCSVCGKVASSKKVKVVLNASTLPLQVKKSTTALKIVSKDRLDKVVSWTSSNPRIVRVNRKNGKLTAKKTGRAYVTVKMKSGATARCRITVQKKKVAVSKLKVSPSAVYLKKGERKRLTAVVAPLTAADKVTYSSSDKRIASVNSKGTISAKKKGTAKITVKAGKKKKTVKVVVR